MNRDEMRRLFETHREAEAVRDLDAVLATFADDCFLETVALGLRSEGRDAARAAYEGYFTAFPDLSPDHLTLAPRPPAEREVLMPLDPEQVVEGMRQYQRLLRDLLEPSDWQTEDKHGNRLERPFLKKSGWRKIARAFNLSFERVRSDVERDEDGEAVRAEVWIRAVAPNGQFGDGDGYCSSDEGRFTSWRGRQKLENDLRSTATTRAKNRATADLVGMGEVSAEEIEAEGEHREPTGPACDAELARTASRALVYLAGGNEPAERIWDELAQLGGGQMPALGARAIVLCARALRGGRDSQAAVADTAGPVGTERRAA